MKLDNLILTLAITTAVGTVRLVATGGVVHEREKKAKLERMYKEDPNFSIQEIGSYRVVNYNDTLGNEIKCEWESNLLLVGSYDLTSIKINGGEMPIEKELIDQCCQKYDPRYFSESFWGRYRALYVRLFD